MDTIQYTVNRWAVMSGDEFVEIYRDEEDTKTWTEGGEHPHWYKAIKVKITWEEEA